MAIYKRCGRCGNRIPSGSNCPCIKERHKEYDQFSRDKKSKGFYDSGAWKRKRKEILDLDDGIDVYLYMTAGEIKLADTVHHIESIRENWEKRLDTDNLMSLSSDTHGTIECKYKENKTKMIEELEKMLKKYREGV